MARTLVVIGSGGLARRVVQAIHEERRHAVFGLVDEYACGGREVLGVQVIGTPEDVPGLFQAGAVEGVVLAADDPESRAHDRARLQALVPDLPVIPAEEWVQPPLAGPAPVASRHTPPSPLGLDGGHARTAKGGVRIVADSSPEWLDWLAGVPHDIFHTPQYHRVAAEWAGADAFLAVAGDRDRFVAWPGLLRRIVDDAGDHRGWDITSVYGYSGPLARGADAGFVATAWTSFAALWRSWGVVSVFTRFHPILANHVPIAVLHPEGDRSVGCRGHTIAIDLTGCDDAIWNGYKRQLRKAIRRGREAGLQVTHDTGWCRLPEFVALYYRAMKRNRADAWYYFPTEHFRRLRDALGVHGSLLLVTRDDVLAAAVLLIEYGGLVAAHLAAYDRSFRALEPLKFALHESALWSRGRGNGYLHIGGGRGGRDEDPLFSFKAAFSSARFPFCTGRWVLDAAAARALADARRDTAARSGFSLAPNFFPEHRAPFVPTA